MSSGWHALQEDGTVDTRNFSHEPGWLAAIGAGVLAFASIGLMGCYGSDTDDAATGTDEAPIVLTQAEEAELNRTIDQSKHLLDGNAPQDSLALLERSIEINPNSFAAHNNLCVAYGMLALRDKAVTECERAVKLDPNSQLGKNNLQWVSSLPPAVATAAPAL